LGISLILLLLVFNSLITFGYLAQHLSGFRSLYLFQLAVPSISSFRQPRNRIKRQARRQQIEALLWRTILGSGALGVIIILLQQFEIDFLRNMASILLTLLLLV
jgi:hypothetical protein